MAASLHGIFSILYTKQFEREYREIMELGSAWDLERYQKSRLSNLLNHCNVNVPYYSWLFDEIGLIHDRVVDFSRFPEIPILTKKIIRENMDDLKSRDLGSRNWFYATSGGSTGEMATFIHDKKYQRYGWATNYYYHKNFLNFDRIKNRELVIWGNERDLLKGGFDLKTRLQMFISNSIVLNSFRMSESTIVDYINIINLEKPEYIRGYAGPIYQICNYAREKNIEIHSPRIVSTTSEVLSDEMRGVIETVLGTKVYNFYGSREVHNFAGECDCGNMHIFSFLNLMEVVDTDAKSVNVGQSGRILVTPLQNYAMPLIRYEMGDLGILGEKTCQCGSILPTLKAINGRTFCNFRLKDGSIIWSEAFCPFFYFLDWVKQFQIIQEDYDIIRIIIAKKGQSVERDKYEIEEKIRAVMGKECHIFWECVDEIPPARSGKFFFTISKVE
jgi:phenylacetate-CoA ligase